MCIVTSAVADFGGIEVWYGIDGDTPQIALLYFKVDQAFPKLKETKEEKKRTDQPGKTAKAPTVSRKHGIDVDHWNKVEDGMTKEQITNLLMVPAGDYAAGTEFPTRSWG